MLAAAPMSRVGWIWLVLVCFAVGTSMVTPLIPIYQQQLGFNDTVVTLFLGSYVVTLVPSMLGLGQLSDRVRRRGSLPAVSSSSQGKGQAVYQTRKVNAVAR